MLDTECIAIDGARLNLSTAGAVGASFSSVGVLDMGVPTEWTVNPNGIAGWLSDVSGVTPKSLSLDSGTLLVGSREEENPSIGTTSTHVVGVWEGKRYSLVHSAYNVEVDEVVARFNGLQFGEQGSGIAVEVSQEKWLKDPVVIREVVGMGIVEVKPLTDTQIKSLPRFEGTSVDSGELYRSTMNDTVPYLTLVTDTAVCTVMPDDRISIDLVTQRVAEISVTWSVPARSTAGS